MYLWRKMQHGARLRSTNTDAVSKRPKYVDAKERGYTLSFPCLRGGVAIGKNPCLVKHRGLLFKQRYKYRHTAQKD
jgi:hypothetical protein